MPLEDLTCDAPQSEIDGFRIHDRSHGAVPITVRRRVLRVTQRLLELVGLLVRMSTRASRQTLGGLSGEETGSALHGTGRGAPSWRG